MPEVNFALSSAAQKQYQKQCTGLYSEFQKKMNAIFKEEQGLRDIMRKLRKEKITNNKYSLYRSSGADLFAKASQKRKTFMSKNLTTVSPLLDELCPETPWGLDAIIDEDLIRPQTAPGNQQGLETTEPVVENNGVRPHTAAPVTVSNTRSFIESNEVVDNAPELKHGDLAIPESKIAQIDRLLKGLQKEQSQDGPSPVQTDFEDMGDNDGEVDPNTERTRARKITINATKFAQLQSGETHVKLKDKDGKFIVKPLNINYEPTEVEAVFFAKDPTKEKMALVRQKTSCRSSTVASDLKVNNRIAIQKSLMGKLAKKTTVAEIFNNARDRRTRHFRIMLKNPTVSNETVEKGDANNGNKTTSKTKQYDNRHSGQNDQQNFKNPEMSMAQDQQTDKQKSLQDCLKYPMKLSSAQKPLKTILRDTSTPLADKSKRLQIIISPAENIPAPEKSPPHGQKLFQRVKAFTGGDETGMQQFRNNKFSDSQESNQMPLDRSQSSMSMREGMNYHTSDKHMTEMIRRLVEGKSDDNINMQEPSNLGVQRKFIKMPLSKKKNQSGSDTHSNAGSSVFSTEQFRRHLGRNDAKNMIRDAMRRDREYEDAMQSMRRRVALGAGLSRRPNSVAAFR
ncbi:hypothetical protein FSP39_002577 [Pinctada imbricata]|uniref:Uncharacterized protein n=1 Tax=Pinctada imbricata TaxID=66713 RepID=A0AA88XV49_PINIB|nr:hypothetical protein FSP39_002577 [Pinctada imbricata]